MNRRTLPVCFRGKKHSPLSLGARHSKRQQRSVNVVVQRLSAREKQMVERQERDALEDGWRTIKREPLDMDTFDEVEAWHGVKFKNIFERLKQRFPGATLNVLSEGAGKSTFKDELLQKKFGAKLRVTATDVRQGKGWPDKIVNVLGLGKEFGENKFHLVESTAGGAAYSPLPEKALAQIVFVLRPYGIGVVTVGNKVSQSAMLLLERKLGIRIWKNIAGNIVFTKLSKRRS